MFARALSRFRILSLAFAASSSLFAVAAAQEPKDGESKFQFREIELPERLTVGYAVRLIDMDGDERLDIVVLDSKRLIWFQNPTWDVRTIYSAPDKADNVCFAAHDIDGDGRLDFALGADWTLNTKQGGTIQWLSPPNDPSLPWELHPIGEEPTVHRMNFGDLDHDGTPELLILPLMGRNTTGPEFAEAGVRFLRFPQPGEPRTEAWEPDVLTAQLHVAHNFQVTDLDHDGVDDVVVVSFEGVHFLRGDGQGGWKLSRIGEGDQESRPRRGASEIRRGHLGEAPTADYLATIEPWHGDKVVVYLPPAEESARYDGLWTRKVLDTELAWGHAVKCANLDDDPEQELIIGVRDPLSAERPFGVRVYDPADATGESWTRSFVDPGGVAVEDLDVGDLDGDGAIDLVAVGRKTGNVKIYLNRAGK